MWQSEVFSQFGVQAASNRSSEGSIKGETTLSAMKQGDTLMETLQTMAIVSNDRVQLLMKSKEEKVPLWDSALKEWSQAT